MNLRNISHRGRSIAWILAAVASTLCLAAGVNARTSFTSRSSVEIFRAAHRTDLPMRVIVPASDCDDCDDYVGLLAAAGI
jgi:hypothetical protein